MKKKSDKFDRQRSNKVPIFKKDLEFSIFHAQTLDKIRKDKVNFQKRFFEKVIEELTNSKENNKVGLLKKMIFDNNIENFRLEGLNRLDREKDIVLENNILRYLIKNYQLIPFEHNSKNELDVIYQTSYFVNKFSNSDQKIGILYDKLIADNYIDCSKRTFSSIFFIKNNFPKVNWLESQSSFQFFILKLVENKKISCNCKWVVAAACFLLRVK